MPKCHISGFHGNLSQVMEHDSDHRRLLYDLIKLSKALDPSFLSVLPEQDRPKATRFPHRAFLQVPVWLDCKPSEGRDQVWPLLFSSYLGCNRIPIHWASGDRLLGDSSDWAGNSHVPNWDVSRLQTSKDMSCVATGLLWCSPLPPACAEKTFKQAAWFHTPVSAGWQFYCLIQNCET